VGARSTRPVWFDSPAAFRAWLDEHHETATELLVGFHKVGTGRPSMTWSESVDQALCFGWIDGVRRRVDDERYTIRFTPRKPGSIWSKINVAKVAELERQGLLRPAGATAFAARRDASTGVYSFEQDTPAELPRAMVTAFRADEAAWRWWQSQPPGYRRTATHWVTSAKREETRQRRFATLVADCAAGRRLKQYDWTARS
jgi:uncharacterized protein YdeI (YjbR/CyaY-like superfamily)